MFLSSYCLSPKRNLNTDSRGKQNCFKETLSPSTFWKSQNPTTQSSNSGTSFFSEILHPLTSTRINNALKLPHRISHPGAVWVVQFYTVNTINRTQNIEYYKSKLKIQHERKSQNHLCNPPSREGADDFRIPTG